MGSAYGQSAGPHGADACVARPHLRVSHYLGSTQTSRTGDAVVYPSWFKDERRVLPKDLHDDDPTLSQRNSIPVSTIYKKEWPWKKTKAPPKIPPGGGARRRDSVASSVGAASVRRLIARQPPKIPKPIVQRFTLLCFGTGACATAFLPFTAYAGAEAGALPLAMMHAVAAVVAPFSPLILQKTGTRVVIVVAHILVSILLTAHTVAMPLTVLLPLYGICGVVLSPMSLALAASAVLFAQTAGDEPRRRIVLRRALRALRASQDLGLIFGSLLLGGAITFWPEEVADVSQFTPYPINATTTARWPPPEEFFLEDDYEERTCGAAGCPDMQSISTPSLSAEGRSALVGLWAALAFASVGFGVLGASPAPVPPPDSRSILKDPRAILGAPMGLFIGLQQGFIYTSYIKWYGVCVGGWSGAWRALCGAGLLATLAAGTASMWAGRGGRGGRARRAALAAGGGAAHASLVLALLRWRAARADLALPAVAAAAWAACAALWDVLQSSASIGGAGWRGTWAALLAARHAGLAAACAARAALCVRSQLAALAASLVLALATHAALEIKIRKGDAARHRS